MMDLVRPTKTDVDVVIDDLRVSKQRVRVMFGETEEDRMLLAEVQEFLDAAIEDLRKVTTV
jgi:hypothetical protein